MPPTMTDEDPFVTTQDGDFPGSEPSDSDYLAIEAAVMETVRGRWFLREYAKRNRQADTEIVLDAVNRLQDETLPGRAVQVMDHLHTQLTTVATAFAQTRREIALLPPADRIGLSPLHPDLPLSVSDAQGIGRIERVLKTLRYLEARLHALRAICGPDAPVDDAVSTDRQVATHPSFLM